MFSHKHVKNVFNAVKHCKKYAVINCKKYAKTLPLDN